MSLHLNKSGLRALGIAESFVRTMPHSILAGAVMRSDLRVDGLAYARASVGGDDATGAVLDIYRELDRKDINAILLEGAVISWFNVIDLEEVGREGYMPLFVVLRPGVDLTDELKARIKGRIRDALSPRHVPDDILAIPEVPRTLNGKKLEVPIKKILLGASPERAANPDAMANPAILAYFVRLAAQLRPRLGR